MNIIDELEATAINNCIDIACITESWLNVDVATQLVNLARFICYRRDRQDGRRGGGVICYIRNNLSCMHLKHLEVDDIESMWFLYRACKMPRLVSHIAVGVIYHPPKSESKCVISYIMLKYQLNADKTEVIWFGSYTELKKLSTTDRSLIVEGTPLQPSEVVRDLGVLLDSEMTMKPHVSKLTSVC
jgi:hypothetical protein